MKHVAVALIALVCWATAGHAADRPPYQRHYHADASGRLNWTYSEGWIIQRSWRTDKGYTYTVYHLGHPVGGFGSLSQAKRFVTKR